MDANQLKSSLRVVEDERKRLAAALSETQRQRDCYQRALEDIRRQFSDTEAGLIAMRALMY